MKEYVCQVVPVYVRPLPITDEKACIGVIVRCPEANVADYRLADQSPSTLDRIAGFFPRFGRENLMRSIAWARHDIEYSIAGADSSVLEKRFANLIRPRENVVQYGAPQIRITDNPRNEVDGVYHMLVA